MTERPIRDGVIATVVGGILLTLLGWAVGWLPSIGRGIARAAKALGAFLTAKYIVTLPLWFWLLLSAGGLVLVRSLWRRRLSAPASHETEEVEVTLAPDEAAILRVLELADMRAIPVVAIGGRAQISNLRASAALDSLQSRGLVALHRNVLEGSQVGLTAAGRDLLLGRVLPRATRGDE